MNIIKSLVSTLVTIFLFTSAAQAQVNGTREEAKALTLAAVEHVKKVGPDQAFKDFTADKATWAKKDLYIIAYDNKGTCVAHGVNEKLVGKNLLDVKDPNGKLIVRELMEVLAAKGSGWVDYDWAHPITKKVEGKSTFAMKLPNYDGWIGVGVYR